VDDRFVTGLLGARSLVGECVISLLVHEGRDVIAFSRSPAQRKTEARVSWLQLDEHSGTREGHAATSKVSDWLCVAPIWVLPQYFSLLEAYGVRRVVALSSTSRFTKDDSSDPEEQAIALRLAEAEARVQAWAESHGVEWIILRPTLIYGRGRDKNIAEIARFVRRFGVFPLFGKAKGLRQPLHAHDVAGACIAALGSPAAANRAYNLSGAETLAYRDMVARIFSALGRPVRLLPVPLFAFRFAVAILRLLPRYRNWSSAMAERMNRDLVFDHSEATRDFGFEPRAFVLNRPGF
jgi:uncharacterized protein YbjT (DUF2867 family)